jgi:tetratricopeptide (TPR) repeat protein
MAKGARHDLAAMIDACAEDLRSGDDGDAAHRLRRLDAAFAMTLQTDPNRLGTIARSIPEDPLPGTGDLAILLASALRHGDLEGFASTLRRASDASGPEPHAGRQWVLAIADATRLQAAGELRQARTAWQRAFELGQAAGIDNAEGAFRMQVFAYSWDRGRLGRERDVFEALLAREVDAVTTTSAALSRLEDGDHQAAAEAATLLDALDHRLVDIGSVWPQPAAALAECCFWLDLGETAGRVLPLLQPYEGLSLSVGEYAYFGSTGLALGQMTAATGDLDGAIEHFGHARAEDTKAGAPVWAARAAVCEAHVRNRRGRGSDRRTAETLISQARRTAAATGAETLTNAIARCGA